MIEVVDQKITNADRIRSMTDEELGVIIMCPYNLDPIRCSNKECNDCCLDWLQKEAK